MHRKQTHARPGITRRECLIRLTAAAGLIGCAGGRIGAASAPPPTPPAAAPKRLVLTPDGGDRATGYVMSNKIARRNGNLVCTWLDFQRQNRWALVDPRSGEILRSGAVDTPRLDNHCGTAITTDVDGTLHLLVGAHHGAFIHYRMEPDKADWQPVEDGAAVGRQATYPSLVCGRDGTLHVTYRLETGGHDPELHYCRRPKEGPWSQPRALARSVVKEHSWLTGAIEVAETGRLHVVFSNTLPVPAQGDKARYYGASHLYSDDAGQTWRQFGDAQPLAVAADAAGLKRIEAPDMPPERIEARYRTTGTLALTSYYHKMVLSNPAIDPRGRPWVIVHNLLIGDALLYRHEEQGGQGGQGTWIGVPLLEPVRTLLPGYRIRHCGQLSRRGDRSIEAVLMASPDAAPAWGAPGTTLVRLVFDADARLASKELVSPPDPAMPQWLPSLERWSPHAPFVRPALLYTRGLNAGGGKQNVNEMKTEVGVEVGE